MNYLLLQAELGQLTNTAVSQAGNFVSGNWVWLVIGIVLIIVTVLILKYIKDLIINSIIGIIAWLIIYFGLPLIGVDLKLNFVTSLVVSALFGLAGLGVLIIVKFLGLQI